MSSVIRSFALLLVLVALPLLSAQCEPNPLEPTSIPSPMFSSTVTQAIQIGRVEDQGLTSTEIVQQKTFDQCNSASVFKAQAQFSQVSSEQAQQELILRGEVGGEIGVSAVAKAELRGAIEQRFGSASSSQQGQQESASMEVPAHTKQEYTIVWRDTRREGRISYTENGENRSAAFSYRIGVELVSSVGKDVPCEADKSLSHSPAAPTPALTHTPYPTYTPYPTHTPCPTYTPYPAQVGADITQGSTAAQEDAPDSSDENTPVGATLTMGEWWKADGVWLRLSEIEYSASNSSMYLYVEIWNKTTRQIIFDWAAPRNFMLTDNTGHKYVPHSQYESNSTNTVDPNERTILAKTMSGWTHTTRYPASHVFASDVKELRFSVEDLSRIKHAVWLVKVPK